MLRIIASAVYQGLPARGAVLCFTTLTAVTACALFLLIASVRAEEPGGGGAGGGGLIGPVGRDFTGDGHIDFLVPRPISSIGAPVAGYVRVYSGATRNHVFTLVTGEKNDAFGVATDSAGDVNGDGCDDIIVAAPRSSRGGLLSGAVYLFSGSTGDLLSYTTGLPYERLGRAVAGMGDLNGDGVSDFAASGFIEGDDGALTGVVHIFSGADPTIVLASILGPPGMPSFGEWICAPGDLNGNGAPDLAIAAPRAPIGEDLAGAVYIFHGDPAEPAIHVSRTADDAHAVLHNQIPGVYDFGRIMLPGRELVNRRELIVGSAYDIEAGRVRSVHRAYDGATYELLEISDPSPLMIVGDVNADLVIDQADLEEVITNFLGEPDPDNPHNPDVDGDGLVTAADLALVVIEFGQEHPLLGMSTDPEYTASVLSSRAPSANASTHCYGPTHYLPTPLPYPILDFGEIGLGCCLETMDPFQLPIDSVEQWISDCIEWPPIPPNPTSDFTPELKEGVITDVYGGEAGPKPEVYRYGPKKRRRDESWGGGGRAERAPIRTSRQASSDSRCPIRMRAGAARMKSCCGTAPMR